ncbi:unnamed protein product, partial [marine sediment metagenome]
LKRECNLQKHPNSKGGFFAFAKGGKIDKTWLTAKKRERGYATETSGDA